jgi:hypothetical protein
VVGAVRVACAGTRVPVLQGAAPPRGPLVDRDHRLAGGLRVVAGTGPADPAGLRSRGRRHRLAAVLAVLHHAGRQAARRTTSPASRTARRWCWTAARPRGSNRRTGSRSTRPGRPARCWAGATKWSTRRRRRCWPTRAGCWPTAISATICPRSPRCAVFAAPGGLLEGAVAGRHACPNNPMSS